MFVLFNIGAVGLYIYRLTLRECRKSAAIEKYLWIRLSKIFCKERI